MEAYPHPMRLICLSILLLLLGLVSAQAGHSPPKILFRIYVQTVGEGLPANQAQTIPLPPNGEMIQIRAFPEITEHDLVDVQADASDAVHFRFNHQGQVALSAVTAQNQGRILVLMIDGYVFYAPIIDEQLDSGELVMPHHLDPKILKLLQDEAQKNLKEAAKR